MLSSKKVTDFLEGFMMSYIPSFIFGTRARGSANKGPNAMPTALRLTNRALALVRSLRATYIAMYLRLTALAEPVIQQQGSSDAFLACLSNGLVMPMQG